MKYISPFILLFISKLVFGQAGLPEGMDFSEGKWELFVTAGEGTEEEMKKVRNRYSSDREVISDLLSTLIPSPDSQSTGFSHYTESLYLIKNGSVVQRISLYNTLGKVNIDDHYFNYDPAVFYKRIEKLNEIPSSPFTVRDRETALKLRQYLKAQPAVFFPEWDSLWVQFPGRLSYTVRFDSTEPANQNPNFRVDWIGRDSGTGKLFIDVSDTGYSPNEEDAFDRDSAQSAQLELMNAKILREQSIHPGDFALNYYMTDEDGREHYYFYSGEEAGSAFKAFEITRPWQKAENISFVVYGLSLKDVERVIKKLERGK